MRAGLDGDLGDVRPAVVPRWSRGSRPIGRFQTLSEPFVETRQQVAVAVQRESRGRVLEPFGDLLRVGSLRDQQGRASVPKVVEPKVGMEARASDRWPDSGADRSSGV